MLKKNIIMKKGVVLLVVMLCFFNCSLTEKPEFIGVDAVEILEANSQQIILSADAMFLNPNDIGGELKTDEIKVFVNGIEMASVSTDTFKVPSKKEFSVPLKVNFPTANIFKNKNIEALLGSFFGKKVKVQYKGGIVYKILGFSHVYQVDNTEEVKIKF